MERFIESYNNEKFDIIIIGGGITGASVAYDAACRGLKVALVEKSDFGGATSAATSKLIHGGLRYLNNFEFGLVRESLRERRILSNISPNFVYPLPFMIPTYVSFKSNRWLLLAGMILYGLLSYDKKFTWDSSKSLPMFKRVSLKNTKKLEPNVKTKGLTGSTVYYDCQNISPERMTLAFIKSAVKSGAKVSNYTYVRSFLFDEQEKICGVRVKDMINCTEHEIKSKLVINCAGTWVDIVLKKARKGMEENFQIKRSEGIHIITRKIISKHAIAMVNRKGRHFMIMPWRNYSLIGTTDIEYFGNPDEYKVPRHSIEELIDDVNRGYGAEKLTYDDVIFAYGGLRPLVDDQTDGSYKSSRRYEIYDNKKDKLDGIITVEGGKYTTSRNLAINVMKMVGKKLGMSLPDSKTDEKYLAGCEIKDMKYFFEELRKGNSDFRCETLEYVGMNYGTESEKIFQIARENPKYAEPVSSDGEILAEVVYAVQEEMAKTLCDIIFRRTGIGTLGHPGLEVLNKVADCAAELLNWDENKKKAEIDLAIEKLTLPA